VRAPRPLLRSATAAGWFTAARRDLTALLSDHLHCERKAAENALGLLRRYPGHPALADRLCRLAHEETSHLVQVAAALEARGLALRPDTPNHYTRALLAEVRGREPERRLDALLCAALIEARSHERLSLLAAGFCAQSDHALADLYTALAAAEDRHAEIYLELAAPVADPSTLAARLEILAAREAEILAALPHGCRIH
jgi:tRNA 2-(methylsulfanyl)-N6-isopentenyladenosine37 hydroxylase